MTVRLHRNMGVEVVQCAISLLAAIPTTLVHALDFFITSARALVLLGTRNRDKGVDLRQMMLSAISNSSESGKPLLTLLETSQERLTRRIATFHLACADVPCGAKEGAKGFVLAVTLKYTWP